jgi:hypothetical protein
MAKRHEAQKKAKGGGVAPKHEGKREMYTGKGSHVEHEAEEKKSGGKVKKASGGEVKAPGKAAGGRLDKRARGGGVGKVHASGKDMTSSPFSGAHIGHGPNAAEHPHPHHLKHKGE